MIWIPLFPLPCHFVLVFIEEIGILDFSQSVYLALPSTFQYHTGKLCVVLCCYFVSCKMFGMIKSPKVFAQWNDNQVHWVSIFPWKSSLPTCKEDERKRAINKGWMDRINKRKRETATLIYHSLIRFLPYPNIKSPISLSLIGWPLIYHTKEDTIESEMVILSWTIGTSDTVYFILKRVQILSSLCLSKLEWVSLPCTPNTLDNQW